MTAWLAYILLSWLFADFLSGIGHWLEDRYFRADWPIIGQYIAEPNERHHIDQRAFLSPSYLGRNWTTFLVTLPFAVVLHLLDSPLWIGVALASQSNEIHAWSHQRCNRLIRVLQETGILQSPRQHAQHHKAPFDCRYCVMTDWLNPILDECRFWFAIEWFLSWLGIYPKGQVAA